MARRLATIARWINDNVPELYAVLDDWSERSYRKAGRLIVHQGRLRKGKRLTVYWRATWRTDQIRRDKALFEHRSTETYRTNSEVEEWLRTYLVDCKRGRHNVRWGDTCWICGTHSAKTPGRRTRQ